ncbi:MAG: tripartite tricarboxylate transporter substrate binding protein [Pseudomonadota bacterium]
MKKFTILTCLAALGVTSGVAQAEMRTEDGFPQRPITIIVPYGPGGGSDTVARALGNAMGDVLGQSVQVVNKPGGGGLAAVPDFMTAPKDGYTILQGVDIAVANHVAGRLRESPAETWSPLCATQITFSQIYVRPDDDRFSNFESLLGYTKQNPGELTIANVGNPGVKESLLMTFMKDEVGLDMRSIAFDKPSERYASVIGGTVDVLLEQPGDVRSFVEAGQLKPVLTFFSERPAAFSEVPTHQEMGATFDPLLRFRGFFLHPDVPEERRALLAEACEAAFQSEDYQTFNKSKYMDLVDSYRGPDAFKTMLSNEIELYRVAFEKAGL